jgi:hypothetical protein
MFLKFPKDDDRFSWTNHIKNKIVQYRFSESRLKRILNNPDRKEEGIALKTLAVMKRNDRGNKKEEIWLMYQKKQSAKNKALKITMISAWRYPGISKPGKEIPIPPEIAEELGL